MARAILVLWLTAGFLICKSFPAWTQQALDTSRSHSVAADSAAVATTVSAFRRALQVGDSSAAIELLAPDVSVLESGDIETLAEYRSHHLSADIAFARAVRSVSGPLRIVISGDVAWVTSTSTTQGEYRGRRIDSVGAELMILSRSNGRWKIRVIHWSSHARAPRP